MENMDSWEIALLVLVAFVAITALVRLMARHRDELTARFRQELERSKKAAPATPAEGKRRRAA